MKLFAFQKNDLYASCLILTASILTIAELFLTPGRSANMDGIVHTITPNLFYLAMKNGEFPIGWIDGFANYGLPLGLIAHQTTTYATALLQFVVVDPVVAFNIVAFIGFFLSSLFFYFFLRLYFTPIPAVTGVLLFNLAPYRILNIFIRGAMPEFFAGVFIPLILIGLYLLIQKRASVGGILIAISVCALALSHPFMLVISAFLLIPYFFYLIITNTLLTVTELKKKKNIALFFMLVLFTSVGILMSGYFLFPLLLEIKYFYYGLTKDHLTPNNFLTIKNFFDPQWYYFTSINILPRGFIVNVGFLESLIFIAGLVVSLYLFVRKVKGTAGFLYFCVICGLLIIFFTTQYSEVFYTLIPTLGGIQFPWRLLAVFIFIPPMILSYLLAKSKSIFIPLLIVLFVCIIRFPQLYGKNYVVYPEPSYAFTPLNLHATVMNPIWSGVSEDYPIKQNKGEFIEGGGNLLVSHYTNSSRVYEIVASTPAKLIDYTFYFPGWNVYIDGVKSSIEYQDPKYRGVITYAIPSGKHSVRLMFEDTKIRMAGKVISLISIIIFFALIILRKRIAKLIAL